MTNRQRVDKIIELFDDLIVTDPITSEYLVSIKQAFISHTQYLINEDKDC